MNQPIEEWEVLDLLTALVDKSLVVFETDENGVERYRLLESVRQYSRDRLLESEEAPPLYNRYLEYCLYFTQQRKQIIESEGDARWLARLDKERENILSALEWGTDNPDTAIHALQLASAYREFWLTRSLYTEAREWLSRALAHGAEVSPFMKARTLNDLAYISNLQCDYVIAADFAARGMEQAKLAGNDRLYAFAQMFLAWAKEFGKQVETLDEVAGLCLEAREYALRANDAVALASSSNLLCSFYFYREDYENAEPYARESVEAARKANDPFSEEASLDFLGAILIRKGRIEPALDIYKQMLISCQVQGNRRNTAYAAYRLAEIYTRRDLVVAARLMGAGDGLLEAIRITIEPVEQPFYDRVRATIESALESAVFEEARRAGKRLPFEEIVKNCLSLIDAWE